MSPRCAALMLAWLLTFSVPEMIISRQAFRTPELFGDAQAVLVEREQVLYGLIYNADFIGVITGTMEAKELTCQIRQLAGEPVQDLEGAVPCFARRRGDRWLGWIHFRGHPRKFCGAPEISSLPEICRLSEDRSGSPAGRRAV